MYVYYFDGIIIIVEQIVYFEVMARDKYSHSPAAFLRIAKIASPFLNHLSSGQLSADRLTGRLQQRVLQSFP